MKEKLVAVLVVTLAWACGSSPIAPAPTSGAPAVPPATPGVASLSGTVLEWGPSSQRPLANVAVNAWVQTDTFGYSYWYRHGRLTSDAQGHYELKELPLGATVYVDVSQDGYRQQCAAEATMTGPSELDTYLIPESAVSASTATVPSRQGTRSIAGLVYEATSSGRRVVTDAVVAFEAVLEYNAASTISDAQGRFLLCGLSPTRAVRIVAYSGNRYGEVTVPPGADATVDLQVR